MALLGALAGCSRTPPAAAPVEAAEPEAGPGFFEDLTAASGVAFTYRNGEEANHYTILESLGGGVALLDFDHDGKLDIFLTGGGYFDGPEKKQIRGHPCRLYRNLGNWKFEDVTAQAGLDKLAGGQEWFYTHGAAVGDYDADGWPDLLVTGYGRLALFHNEPGAGGGRRFVEVTARAGLTDNRAVHWSTSAAWADFDLDGKLDLFVTHYVDWSWQNNPRCPGYRPDVSQDVCPPKRFQGLPASLFLNNGDGSFRDGSAAAGLKAGKGLGVVAADLDQDGRIDIYVANDTVDNFLYLNQGGGRFREEGGVRGVAYDDAGLPNGSMGVDVADYNGTGRLSIFVTNYQHEQHALYRNLGNGLFAHSSRAAGVSAIGLTYVGFGTAFFDYDRDGWEDLVIANGHVIRYPHDMSTLTQRPVLLRNQRGAGDGPAAAVFKNVTDGGGPYFHRKHLARGLALGDLDNDGRPDLVVSHVNAPVILLRNAVDNGQHWLGVGLTGRPLRDAVGARLELEAGGRTFVRTIKGGGSYLSGGDPRVIFGLSGITAVKCLTVRWPSGKINTWQDLSVDRYWYLTESDPTPRADSHSAAGSSPSAAASPQNAPGRPHP